MNHWRQTKRYRCTGCGAKVLHDKMHGHWAFECPSRQLKPTKPKRPARPEKVYAPKAS